ncbi:MAG: hypothetical protein EPO11_09765, partial [Gammaproteobacteria bacterium]
MGNNLVLLMPRHLQETSIFEWRNSLNNCVLMTANDDINYVNYVKANLSSCCQYIEFFDNYHHSDLIEKRITELNTFYRFKKIIVMAEVDILRTARVRGELKIEGQDLFSAVSFRDKHVMKTIAQKNNVLVPRFRKITNTFDLLDFIRIVDYPIIIKPLAAR